MISIWIWRHIPVRMKILRFISIMYFSGFTFYQYRMNIHALFNFILNYNLKFLISTNRYFFVLLQYELTKLLFIHYSQVNVYYVLLQKTWISLIFFMIQEFSAFTILYKYWIYYLLLILYFLTFSCLCLCRALYFFIFK